MADRPLILFAEPQQVPKEKGHGGPPNFAHPTYAQLGRGVKYQYSNFRMGLNRNILWCLKWREIQVALKLPSAT
jgi:hypothetical protein